ncbi:MAG: hypothetical protein H7A51_11145 [Akkermansiaceae bacterium]|nr:hypothetical protein [Akkermansiaceae bacterium]
MYPVRTEIMKVSLFQILITLFTVGVIIADGVRADEPEELLSLRKAYADAHVEALEPLTKKYMQALASLKKKLSQAGDLEGAIIVESEEKGTNKTAEKDQPRQLVRLNRIYESSREKISAEVTAKYINALKELQVKLTKSGDLEGAVQVKTEYEKYVAETQGDKKDASEKKAKLSRRQIEKIVTSGEWEWRSSHKFSGKPAIDNVKFYEDGRCSVEWIWKWEIASSTSLKVTFHDRNYYVFDMDYDKKRGVSNIEEGSFRQEEKARASIMLKK